MATHPKIIIIGGGIAGLMAAIKIAEKGVAVQIVSSLPIDHSLSMASSGGINAALNLKGEGDSPEKHFEDTIAAGDFLANQELPRQMCTQAPEIINLLARMGVLFNRTSEGFIDCRRFGGSRHHRTAHAFDATGQQIFSILNQQRLRFEADGLIEKVEGWEFLSIVKDGGGICRGIVAIHSESQELKAFLCDAVVVCTGGPSRIFSQSTGSISDDGLAVSQLYQQGAVYANGEFIQIHPTTIPGEDKFRPISEAALASGGRIWVSRNGKPWYFLEEWYPGNLLPRDVAARAIHKVIFELGLGIDGKPFVNLDLTHLPSDVLHKKLKRLLARYKKYTGEDPAEVPMKVTPAVSGSMGGLWIDDDHRTNIPGVLAAGECDSQYHGANRLAGNLLLSTLFGGIKAGEAAVRYCQGLMNGCDSTDASFYSLELKRQWALNQEILNRSGKENPHTLHEELGAWMSEHAGVVRHNDKLKLTDEKLQELMQRMRKISLTDRGGWMNQELLFIRRLHGMLELARVIVQGALLRNESRGAHYKPEFPQRDDRNLLKTTKAGWTPDGPKIEYEDVNVKYMKPRPREF